MNDIAVSLKIGSQNLVLAGRHEIYMRGLEAAGGIDGRLLDLVQGLGAGAAYLDVGANIGATALSVAMKFPRADVIAFEPVAENAAHLRANQARNDIANCRIVQVAVGDRTSTAFINSNGPWSFIHETGGADAAVPMITLDDYCAQHLPGRRVDIIKIDVEGYEPNVLAGAREIIQTWRPVIFMEFNSWSLLLQGYDPIAFSNYLLDAFEIEPQADLNLQTGQDLVHDNLVRHGCVNDLTMRPRAAAMAAPPGAFKFKQSALLHKLQSSAAPPDQLRLREEFYAIKNSTSWRVTAPLRAASRFARKLVLRRR